MRNEYGSAEIAEVGQAQFVIQGAKGGPSFDSITGSDLPQVIDPQTDLDE